MSSDPRTVAIIPAFNEARTIARVIGGVEPHVSEVVVIDDGSEDDTRSAAAAAGATVISHETNQGVGAALQTGYEYAARREYDRLVQLDGDGQHDPDDLPELLAASEPGALVIGSRYRTASIDDYSRVRRAGITLFSHVVNLAGRIHITDVTSGYRVFYLGDRPAIGHDATGHWAVEQTLTAAMEGIEIVEVPTVMPQREYGASQFGIGAFLLYPPKMAAVIARVFVRKLPIAGRG